MFVESKKQKSMSSSSNQQNMITQGTSFVGDLVSETGFRIEGRVTRKRNYQNTMCPRRASSDKNTYR